MPALIIVYLLLFLVLSIGGWWDDFQEHRPVWHLVSDVVSTAVITVLFVSRWHASFRPPWPAVAQIAFVAATAWEAFQFVTDLRNIQRDPDFSRRENFAFAAVSVVVVSALLLPAFIVAGIAAFKRP